MPHNYQLETERRMGVRQQQLIKELRAENERLRAALEKWRPGIERAVDWYLRQGDEVRAKAFAAMLSDFDATLGRDNCP